MQGNSVNTEDFRVEEQYQDLKDMLTEDTREDNKEETKDIHMDIIVTRIEDEDEENLTKQNIRILNEQNFEHSDCSSSESDLPQ